MKVTVTKNLNVRVGEPRLNAPCNQYLAPGSILEVDGKYYHGDFYEGNNQWMKDEAGNYYWSGGIYEPSRDISHPGIQMDGYLNLDQIWKYGQGEGITIAVIDTCINKPYPDLDDALDIPRSKSYLSDSVFRTTADTSLQANHGTQICHLIASRGKNGFQGISPKSKIVLYSVACFNYKKDYSSEYILLALDDISKQDDIKIVNLSFNMGTLSDTEVQQIQEKVTFLAEKKGKLMFAATGNGDFPVDCIDYPARFTGVIAVGAVREDNGLFRKISEFNTGEELFCCCAADKLKFFPADHNYFKPSTSFATAILSGMTANYLSNPSAQCNSVAEFKKSLLDSLVDLTAKKATGSKYDNSIGYGVFNPVLLFSNLKI